MPESNYELKEPLDLHYIPTDNCYFIQLFYAINHAMLTLSCHTTLKLFYIAVMLLK
jgi:hypothetical protein